MTALRLGFLLWALLGLFSPGAHAQTGAHAQAVAHRPRVNLAAVPIGRMDLPWWRARFAQTLAEAQADPGAKLIWLGDSITQYWTRTAPVAGETILPVWQHYYAPYHALDFGFIGDTTASVIWRVDHGQLAGLHPKLIVILIGANNLGLPHWGARRTVPGIEAVVRDVHRHAPGAKILLLGVLPSIRSAWVSAQTVRINDALARIYRHNRLVTFRNPGVVLLRDGRADRNLFIDPFFAKPEPALHPNRHGMTLIAQNLAPTVTRLMGAAP